MMQIAAFASQFSIALVLLAALVCAAGSFTVIALLGRAIGATRRLRGYWLAGLCLSFGADVWATHFIAMLAFNPGIACTYRMLPTVFSIGIAIAGCILPFAVIIRHPGGQAASILGGAGLGLTIGAMHFTGMSAMEMPVSPSYNPVFVVLSLAAGIGMATLAARLTAGLGQPRNALLATLWLMLAICGLHFTAMGGFSLPAPVPQMAGHALQSAATLWLAAVVAGVSGVIIFFALAVVTADRKIHAVKSRQAEKLQHFARHDELTNLPNRLFLRERLAQMTAAGAPDAQEFALFYVDLDRFKMVNDIFGHPAGDILLTKVAERIRALIRDTDMPARFGGDEFIILQQAKMLPSSAAALAARLVKSLAEPFFVEDHSLLIGASIGIAIFPAHGKTVEELFRNADAALYRAKAEGGGCYCFFDPEISQLTVARRTFEQEFYQAVENRNFVLHYQPIFQCRTAVLCGFEALLRWAHPIRGLVSPAEFIPFAEKSGLIIKLGLWVMETACAQAASWPAPLRVAVNVSAVQLRDAEFFEQVCNILHGTGLPPARLEIEVTESALIESLQPAQTVLRRLKNYGVQLALDDFGTGYSSLIYLRRFSFDRIKIDRSFMQNLETDEDSAVIVSAIIGLGHSLRIGVTAEGVERPAQLGILREQGCDQVQGFLLGRPAALENILPAIEQRIAAAGETRAEHFAS